MVVGGGRGFGALVRHQDPARWNATRCEGRRLGAADGCRLSTFGARANPVHLRPQACGLPSRVGVVALFEGGVGDHLLQCDAISLGMVGGVCCFVLFLFCPLFCAVCLTSCFTCLHFTHTHTHMPTLQVINKDTNNFLLLSGPSFLHLHVDAARFVLASI